MQKQIDFLTDKFTNNSLYDWMVSSLSPHYFQSYQLAYQMCRQVERCYQFELGIQNSSFIQFGYWDSLHKGLLAGETLNHDLRRMQAAYLQQNGRRYELSRYVSLAMRAQRAAEPAGERFVRFHSSGSALRQRLPGTLQPAADARQPDSGLSEPR